MAFPLHQPLYVFYTVISWVMVIYAANFYYLLYRSYKGSRRPKPRPLRDYPLVTVQLPIYNERYVAGRLIRAVCQLDYPKDRLEIQVLDDSSDDTQLICRRLVEEYAKRGYQIYYIHRDRREGYKAGALREGLARARGEFIAIFDADFLPQSDFLKRALSYFSDPAVALVQARWGHLNEEYSTLTRAQALNLDLHFLIEQQARGYCHLFMNFNGTAGIWRRSAIEAAGGWQDCLAEDYDLSLRAQLRGWRFVFLPELVCPAELPVQMNAAKRQQFRWAKGAGQCTKRFLKAIWLSDKPFITKLQATLQVTRHVVHVLLIAQFLLLPLLMASQYELFPATALIGHLILGPVVYIVTIRSLWPYEWWVKIAAYIYLLLFGSGVSVNNAWAFLSAFLGGQSEFARTPKFGIIGRGKDWRGLAYALPFLPSALVELALAAYGVGGITIALLTENFLYLPYLTLTTLGFLYVGGLTIAHSLGVGTRREQVEERAIHISVPTGWLRKRRRVGEA
jgi:cellulose synthase/poly-beta-1,6-N-acetylglucosamine synthase-like glycosyltransferase